MLNWVLTNIQESPVILLFLSLSLGYLLGSIRFGKFQLGGVAGSLLVAVGLSLLNVHIDSGLKALLFTLFIYAVGYESGPQFFRSLGVKTLREIFLALFIAITGFITVMIMARLFHLDKGLAAGLAAGGLTQSAILGTAADALTHMGLPADQLQQLQANVAIGYAVTYIFGSLGAIIICMNVLPKIMGRDIRDDAVAAEAEQLKGAMALEGNQGMAITQMVGRIYVVERDIHKTIKDIELENLGITIERIKRHGNLIDCTPSTLLKQDDIILIVGRREAVTSVSSLFGRELDSEHGLEVIVETRNVVFRNPEYANKTMAEIRSKVHLSDADFEIQHGIYLVALHRNGEKLDITPDTEFKLGDVMTIYGATSDINRVVHIIGAPITVNSKTDWAYHGLGVVLGLIIGWIVIRVGNIPITLGAGGGALLSGLFFGWLRARKQTFGNMPAAASQFMKDFGLAGFVSVVGLQSGLQAITTIKEHGLTLFLIGVVVTLVPMILAIFFGRYVLRYDNAAVFAGALSGSRSANPAFGEVLDKAGNAIPTAPFAVTYALANVFLTLLGPLIVALV
ncbi:aspartate-alanine antiporter [Snodgrassella communis]|uniref:aspartate-alanine antiporter n=1 Tax=Snodgrassella communis TaxID=2946699 RepID=UPI001EF5CE81|nr:aspartate-alanine antiporter [Snodgrassella communis]